jgi:hypothetical protein
MRKALVALAVAISVVLLQAPAWAPNIYVTQNSQDRPPGRSVNTANVTVGSDICKRKRLAVTFRWGERRAGTTSAAGRFSGTLRMVPRNTGEVTAAHVRSATCDGAVLPFTGAASGHLLVLGMSLLVIGALLVLTSRRHPSMRRG